MHAYSLANAAITAVQNLIVGSGDDYAEAVLDGLDAANTLKWRAKADHLLFHVLDTPPHDRKFHSSLRDRLPDGFPCNKCKRIRLNIMSCISVLDSI